MTLRYASPNNNNVIPNPTKQFRLEALAIFKECKGGLGRHGKTIQAVAGLYLLLD